jgi:hypothetical protein
VTVTGNPSGEGIGVVKKGRRLATCRRQCGQIPHQG